MSKLEKQSKRVYAPLESAARSITDPFLSYIDAQSASGWVLLAVTFLAVCLANSIWSGWYFALLDTHVGFSIAGNELTMTLQHWVNDGLMALFFFLLGLELKRELLVGKLSDLKSASSIVCAAFGGMALPAVIFLFVTSAAETRAGWAIPVATDTAFALMILVLLGDRIPAAARTFLVGLAIVDDLGAILVIALAYTNDFQTVWLIPAALTVGVLASLNLVGIRHGFVYLGVGAVLWFLVTKLGLHGTLAGVIVALAAPVRPAIDRSAFTDIIKKQAGLFKDEQDDQSKSIFEQPEQHDIAREVQDAAEQTTAPLRRWELSLARPISFIVMPLFAFMNAGISFSASAIESAWNSDLTTAIFFALLLGKPIGILLAVWLGRLVGWVDLPSGLSFRHIFGIGILGGIGFTMSLFIVALSFHDNPPLQEIAKQSVIVTSLCAGILGYLWLRWGCRNAGHR